MKVRLPTWVWIGAIALSCVAGMVNAVGFLVLGAAVYFEPAFLAGRQRLVQYALMAFTVITILAWVAIGDKSLPDGLTGYIAKIDELLLLAAVFQYGRLTKNA